MDGKYFLRTARFLQNKGDDEAAYRSAVSRAYYACFIVIRDLVFRVCRPEYRRRAGISNVRKIGHKHLWSLYLNNGQSNSLKQLKKELEDLHTSRTDADYEMIKHTITEEDAIEAVENAENLLNLLYKIPEDEIRTSVNNYLQTIYGNRQGKK